MYNKLKINENTKIYIACPANIATGGPELLHQLCFHLIHNLNIKAYMYYIPNNLDNPIHDEYRNYKVPFVRTVEDNIDNIFIVPESDKYIQLQNNYVQIQKVIWWLSIDNYYNSFSGIRKKINKFLTKRGYVNHYFFDKSLNNNYIHLVQSYYAYKHLSDKNIVNIKYLSDYLNKDFLDIHTDVSKKENIVVYNPKKGIKFTSKIIERSNNKITFVPIENMSRSEVIDLLQKAKVYIDFGFHPGKDRIPREAAILKCCVITGTRGSAKYNEDVPIDEKYKFHDSKNEIDDIIETIEDCLDNYAINIINFENYIEKIKKEYSKFIEDLNIVFKMD